MPRPFRVPIYPLVPAIFILVSAAMLVSAILYVGAGTWFSAVVLVLGGLVLIVLDKGVKRVSGP